MIKDKPILRQETDHSGILNGSNVKDATMESAVRFSVSNNKSPSNRKTK